LGLKNIKYALLEQVKKAYKCHLKDIDLAWQIRANQTYNYQEKQKI